MHRTHLSKGYDDDDIPMMLPYGTPPVRMLIEETIHFDKSFDEGVSEWNYLFPLGGGAFVMGEHDRVMLASLYHELHCVESLSTHIRETNTKIWDHVRHCLEYLLVTSLCQADATLEPGDFTTFNYSESRPGEVRVCRDWEAQYNFLNNNMNQFSLRANGGRWYVH